MADINTTIKLQDRRALSAQPDTGVAKLPGLVRPTLDDAAMARWVDAVSERLEVREGARGNDAERVVTQRQIKNIEMAVNFLKDKNKQDGPDSVTVPLGGGLSATLAIKKFEDLIRATKLYQDLKKRLDDPSRFDDLPQAVRDYVSLSLSEEAAKRGTAITRVEKIINERYTSMAIQVDTLTSMVDQAAAGVRETRWAVSETNRAQAGKITQLEASLGNYYQDGKPGRVLLEEQMTVTADRVAGLNAQYTLKVQAGGALAGFGIAATEVGGVPSSAFIIAANKFAIVDPSTYTGGLTNTPDNSKIPFGVDANGIYLNSTVYVRGSMRVDTGGKTLIDGLRGSVSVLQTSGAWSDTVARQLVWSKIGKSGSPTNSNFLVIGDTATIGSVTKTWNGSAWLDAGMFINGNVVVDGSIAAQKINTNGLDIRDNAGNVIFSSGVNLNVGRVNGLGSLATRDTVNIGWSDIYSDVTVDGVKLKTSDFVHALSKINATNISTFIDSAAIGNAYIGSAFVGNASIDTLRVRGGAVTALRAGLGASKTVSTADAIALVVVDPMPPDSSGVVITGATSVTSSDPTPPAAGWAEMSVVRDDGAVVENKKIHIAGKTFDPWVASITVFDAAPLNRTTTYYLGITIIPNYNGDNKELVFKNSMMTATGGKR